MVAKLIGPFLHLPKSYNSFLQFPATMKIYISIFFYNSLPVLGPSSCPPIFFHITNTIWWGRDLRGNIFRRLTGLSEAPKGLFRFFFNVLGRSNVCLCTSYIPVLKPTGYQVVKKHLPGLENQRQVYSITNRGTELIVVPKLVWGDLWIKESHWIR